MKVISFFRNYGKRRVKQVTHIVIGSIIYAIAVVWFLELGGFFSEELLISQIIVRL